MTEEKQPNAGEPQSENAIADYYQEVQQLEMQGYESHIKKARNTLFVTGALLAVGEFVMLKMSKLEPTPLWFVIVGAEVAAFIALGFWTKTKPYAAVITGIVIFALLWILGIVTTGVESIYKGIFVKIIIFSFLFSAIKPAKAWEEAKKQQIQ